VDQLAGKLQQKVALQSKTEARRVTVQTKSKEAGTEAAELKPKLKLIIEKTRQLQTEVSTFYFIIILAL
jgi:hypothetical protein